MSGILTDPIVDIVRHLFQDALLVTDPLAKGAWPCFMWSEQDSPDNCVTLYDVNGKAEGRNQLTGDVGRKPGVQIRVRAANSQEAFRKIQSIAKFCDREAHEKTVIISGDSNSTYMVHAVTRIGDIMSLGNNTQASPGLTAASSKRWVFTFSVIVSISEEVV